VFVKTNRGVRKNEQGVFVKTNSTNNRSNQITDQKILRIILIILRMIEHALQPGKRYSSFQRHPLTLGNSPLTLGNSPLTKVNRPRFLKLTAQITDQINILLRITDQKILRIILIILRMIEHALQPVKQITEEVQKQGYGCNFSTGFPQGVLGVLCTS